MLKRVFFLIRNIIRRPIDIYKKNNVSITAKLSTNVMVARSSIGRYSYIACNTVIINSEIGNYCSIAPSVQIGGMEHSYWWLSTSTSLSDKCSSNKRVSVGHDVWIGAGSIIKQGVRIGDGAVIGAMSFVNKDVPENSIVFGIPAKIYKSRMDPEKFKRLKATNYWFYDRVKARQILHKFDTES